MSHSLQAQYASHENDTLSNERAAMRYENDNLKRVRDINRRQRDNLIRVLERVIEEAPLFHTYPALETGRTYTIGTDVPHAPDCAACRWQAEMQTALERATQI